MKRVSERTCRIRLISPQGQRLGRARGAHLVVIVIQAGVLTLQLNHLYFYHPVLLLLGHEVSIRVWLLRPSLLGWGTLSQEEHPFNLPTPATVNFPRGGEQGVVLSGKDGRECRGGQHYEGPQALGEYPACRRAAVSPAPRLVLPWCLTMLLQPQDPLVLRVELGQMTGKT